MTQRVPKSPVCAKGGLWPYPCSGRLELQKHGWMKGSFLCEEHVAYAAYVYKDEDRREFLATLKDSSPAVLKAIAVFHRKRAMVAEAKCARLEAEKQELDTTASELFAALRGIVDIGKRDMSNPKYEPYFDHAQAVLDKLAAAAIKTVLP